MASPTIRPSTIPTKVPPTCFDGAPPCFELVRRFVAIAKGIPETVIDYRRALLHFFRCAHADCREAVGEHLARRREQRDTGGAQRGVVDEHAVRAIERVELAGEIAQIERD